MESLLIFGVPGLFLASFLAATILPFSSEILLILLIQQSGEWLLPFAAATTGNILGSVVNYYLGLYGNRFLFYKMFRLKENSVKKATARFRKYGVYSLLFAWVPIVGDPLTVVAGAFKVRFLLFLSLVSAGKTARYAALIFLFFA